jgi:hypothetical protein
MYFTYLLMFFITMLMLTISRTTAPSLGLLDDRVPTATGQSAFRLS